MNPIIVREAPKKFSFPRPLAAPQTPQYTELQQRAMAVVHEGFIPSIVRTLQTPMQFSEWEAFAEERQPYPSHEVQANNMAEAAYNQATSSIPARYLVDYPQAEWPRAEEHFRTCIEQAYGGSNLPKMLDHMSKPGHPTHIMTHERDHFQPGFKNPNILGGYAVPGIYEGWETTNSRPRVHITTICMPLDQTEPASFAGLAYFKGAFNYHQRALACVAPVYLSEGDKRIARDYALRSQDPFVQSHVEQQIAVKGDYQDPFRFKKTGSVKSSQPTSKSNTPIPLLDLIK